MKSHYLFYLVVRILPSCSFKETVQDKNPQLIAYFLLEFHHFGFYIESFVHLLFTPRSIKAGLAVQSEVTVLLYSFLIACITGIQYITLTFESLIYFKLVFKYDIRQASKSLFQRENQYFCTIC